MQVGGAEVTVADRLDMSGTLAYESGCAPETGRAGQGCANAAGVAPGTTGVLVQGVATVQSGSTRVVAFNRRRGGSAVRCPTRSHE